MYKKPYFRPKALIVSDVSHVRTWLKKHLEDQFDIIVETKPSTALQAVKNLELDFIFFDESLANAKPIEFCQELYNLSYMFHTLIYVITGKLKKTYLEKLKKAGAKGFIHSQLNDDELKQVIEKGLDSHKRLKKTSDLFSALEVSESLPSQTLKNRFTQSYRATMEIADSQENETPLSMIMVKVDKYTDTHKIEGKQSADKLLENVSSSIRKNLRKEDIFIPTSDGKFVIIMPNSAEPAAEKFAKDLQKQMEDQGDSHSISMAFSSSVSKRSEASYKEFNRLIKAADRALKKLPSKMSQIIHFQPDEEQ